MRLTIGKYVKCFFCHKSFFRSNGRINESEKMGWKNFCSKNCEYKTKNKQIRLICSREGCNNFFWRQPGQMNKSNYNYCSMHCAAIVNNSKYPKNPGVIKKCKTCGRLFKSRKKYCSRACKEKDMVIPKQEILGYIRNFYLTNKRIPLKRENIHYSAARSRFGTWNEAIKIAGFEPNPVLFSKKYIALDGHKCDSMSERIIDDWLSRRKIQHQRNVKYPGNYGFSVDFKVGNWWIEFFGLEGELKKYDQLKARKLSLIKKEKLKLIDIHPIDLFPKGRIENKLGFLVG